jgi:hypothetical protein
MLLGALDIVVGIDAFAALILPSLLGHPTGGRFLLHALPVFATLFALGALVTLPALGVAHGRFGMPAKVTVAVVLALLAAANVYLWTLCVASV